MFISIDMDETLLSTLRSRDCIGWHRQPDAELTFTRNGDGYRVSVFLRPGVHEMLERLSSIGTLNVFTCGVRKYAHAALSSLDLLKTDIYQPQKS